MQTPTLRPPSRRTAPARTAVLTLLLALPGAAWAQSSTLLDDRAVEMSPFQVLADEQRGYVATNAISATRLNTPIRDLPFNLQVITSEFLEDIVAFNVDDAVRYAAAVTPDPTSREAGIYTLRGFKSARTKRNGFRSYYFHDFGNVERVEVVKGPMSVFYGEAEPGGMINYITKRPREVAGGAIRAIVGSWDYYRGMAEVTGPLFKNERSQLLYRIDLSYERKGTWRHTLEPNEWRSQTFAVGGQVSYQPMPNLRFNVEGLWIDSWGDAFTDRAWIWNPASYATWQQLTREQQIARSKASQDWPKLDGSVGNGAPPYWSAVPPDHIADRRLSNTEGYLDNKVREINATMEVTLPYNLALRTLAQFSTVEHESADYVFGGKNLRASGQAVQGGSPFYILRDNEYFFGVVDLAGDYDFDFVKVRFVTGYEHLDEDFYGPLNGSQQSQPWAYFDPALARLVGTGEIGYQPGLLSPTYPNWPSARPNLRRQVEFTQDTQQRSYYASTQIRFFDERLWLLAGVRRETADIERVDFVQNFNTLATPRVSPSEYRATIPQFGASYRVLPTLSVFGSYSESFKRPASGAIGRTPAGETFTLPPELGEGYDFGVKIDFLDGRLSGTASYFDITRANVPRNIPQDAPALPYTVLSDADTAKGWELDIIYQERIGRGDNQLILSYSNLETASRLGTGVRQIDGVPRLSYAAWNKYRVTEGPLKGLIVGAGLSYVGERPLMSGDARWNIREDSYVLYDALLGYEMTLMGRPTNFTLNAKNVTDKVYNHGGGGGAHPGDPRRIYFSATMRF
jgi:iron complex outermembrane recepter protein